jgi:hypothetical protein
MEAETALAAENIAVTSRWLARASSGRSTFFARNVIEGFDLPQPKMSLPR